MGEDVLQGLEGRSIERYDSVDLHRWRAYHSFFELNPEADRPLALHWLLFHELSSQLRIDGHNVRMEPFPELPFPRRMWAGGEIVWRAPLAVGSELGRATAVARAEVKTGSAGRFVLASLQHALNVEGARYLDERQDIVFLPAESRPRTGAGSALAFEPDWELPRCFGEVELFRYSALTLNSHRIHYDEPYARTVEGYPALVVHGPLMASHIMHAAARQRPRQIPWSFTYRSVAPVFAKQCCRLVGRLGDAKDELAVLGPDGDVRLTAAITFLPADAPK
jgi:3-methylfumaryl-CoA hydratase